MKYHVLILTTQFNNLEQMDEKNTFATSSFSKWIFRWRYQRFTVIKSSNQLSSVLEVALKDNYNLFRNVKCLQNAQSVTWRHLPQKTKHEALCLTSSIHSEDKIRSITFKVLDFLVRSSRSSTYAAIVACSVQRARSGESDSPTITMLPGLFSPVFGAKALVRS